MAPDALVAIPEAVEVSWDTELCLELVRTLLFRNASTQDLVSLMAICGFDTTRDYVAIRARPLAGHSLESLAHELRAAESFRRRAGLIAAIDGELVGFGTLPRQEVRAGVVGIGLPGTPERLGDSFRVASRVLDVAQAYDYMGLQSLETLGLLLTVVADADVGETLQWRYLVRTHDAGSLPELMTTLRTYLACGMRLDPTASAMSLHPNTVRNRIAKFQEATGARLRDRMVAIEVWWALERTAVTGLPTDDPAAALPGLGSRRSLTFRRPVRDNSARDTAKRRAEFLRGLLRGTLTPAERCREIITRGIDDRRPYRALRARPAPGRSIEDLARAHGFTFGRDPRGGLGAVVHGDLVGFSVEPSRAALPGISGVGPPRPLHALSESFRMASRALGIGESRNWSGLCEFERLGLVCAISADAVVGDALYRRYLAPLGDNEFADDVLNTLKVYLREGLHINRTAERLFVHPNTIRYRIRRFEELANVQLRRTSVETFQLLGALAYSAGFSSPGTIATTRHQPASAPASFTGRQLTSNP